MTKKKKVWLVECFDERPGVHIGGSSFLANGVAYGNFQLAEVAWSAAKKNGLAASIRELLVME